MRRSLLAVSSLVLASACGGGSVSTTPASTPPTPTGTGSAPSPTGTRSAGVGDTVKVTTLDDAQLAITLVKYVPDAQPVDEFSTPSPGKQLAAVQLRITNGPAGPVYSDSPDNCVKARDASGQQFTPELAQETTVGRPFSSVHLTAGDSVLGVVVFEVPAGDRLTRVQYTPDSGFASDTAQWTVG